MIYNVCLVITQVLGQLYNHFPSLRSKRFQSSYCAEVRAGAKKKKVEGGGGGEKRKRLPANPTILENAP